MYGRRGSNGKSTIIALITKILGAHFGVALKSLIFDKKGSHQKDDQAATTGKNNIINARFVYIAEGNKDDIINLDRFKRITGGDKDTYRKLHQEQRDYQPMSKIFVATNGMPQMPEGTEDDGGAWRRPGLLPFPAAFVDKPDPNKPWERPKDKNFKDNTLENQAALDYFFTLLVGGAARSQTDQKTSEPECVTDAFNEYKGEQSITELFFSECCDLGGTNMEISSILFASYNKWFGRQYPGVKINYNITSFGRILKSKLGPSVKTGGNMKYEGITIKKEWIAESTKKKNNVLDDIESAMAAHEAAQRPAQQPVQNINHVLPHPVA